MGREYKSWSVFCLRSSAMTRMVRIGMMTANTTLYRASANSKLLTAALML